MAEKSLVVAAPFFNEQDILPLFMEQVARLAASQPVAGLLLVDDGSSDGSVEAVRATAARLDLPVRLVRLSRNFGHQNACLAALRAASQWAAELGAEWVGLIDSDLQDNPLHFGELMAKAEHNDVVYAVRKKRDDGMIRKVFAPMFYRFLARCATFPIPVNAGTFSVMRRELAAMICDISDVDPYVAGLRAFVGFRQAGVLLERADRHKGASRVGLLGLMLLSLRATILYTNAIHNTILYSGLAVFLISLASSLLLFVFNLSSAFSMSSEWKTWLLISCTFGVQMIFLGALGHMVNRVKANTSKQPPFVIMDQTPLGRPGGTAGR